MEKEFILLYIVKNMQVNLIHDVTFIDSKQNAKVQFQKSNFNKSNKLLYFYRIYNSRINLLFMIMFSGFSCCITLKY